MSPESTYDPPPSTPLSRAQGCLAGQIAGDSLGSLVEFEAASSIERRYPGGVRLLSDGGTWGTIAGQPTDDSELALALARSLALLGKYDMEAVARSYADWYASGPFDVGSTTRAALSSAAAAARVNAGVAAAAREAANRNSQANGALMRISPLGIFGSQLAQADVAAFARCDASLTHPHPVCQDSNVVYAASIAFAVRTGAAPHRIYDHALETLETQALGPAVSQCLREAESTPPADYARQQGWVLIALQNAFYQLLHAPNLEEGIVDTVRRGGDTDTNGAIAGALLGAACGLQSVPAQWLECVLTCRPEKGRAGVRQPRPQEYWPIDFLTLAQALITAVTD
jgi:ADP-ribosyl-[dinitrogen reductase] hydrolase